MVVFLFLLSAIGLACLILCIIKLISPLIGWHCKYDPSITEMIADIPKAGRYSINIRRDRFWLWKRYGTISDIFPNVNFTLQRMTTGEYIQYFPRRSLMTSRGTDKMTVLAGYFDAPVSDRYHITTLPESSFLERDEIWIRKHLPFTKLFLLIWGIVLSSLMFLCGLIFGILILTGSLNPRLPTYVPGTLNPFVNITKEANHGFESKIEFEPVDPLIWGNIINISVKSGSFNGGYLSYSIFMRNGEYLLTAKGSNGPDLFIENQPISSHEVEVLRRILEENNISTWNGFRGNNDGVMDGHSFDLSFVIENGSEFTASGYESYPEGYNDIFPLITNYLADIASGYKIEE